MAWMGWAFVGLANVAGFVTALVDKRAARRGTYRVPESRFYFLAVIGAGLGTLLGFLAARHKTRKPRFLLPFIAVTVLGTLLVAWLYLHAFG